MMLSKELIDDIRSLAEHYLEQDDNIEQYRDLRDLIYSKRVCEGIEIRKVSIVPKTIDYIINTMAERIILMEANEEDTCDAENAVWDYLNRVYNFDPEDHDLLKHTFTEALTYAIINIGLQDDDD